MENIQDTHEYQRCYGCGALVLQMDGPTHAYIGASPGCWAFFGEVMAREYSDYRYAPVHQLTVDAYAAQHPGEPSRRSKQSVALHLVSLCLMLERGRSPEQARAALRAAASSELEFPWLEPPEEPAEMTILDIHAVRTPERHKQIVRQYARSVWESWSTHHETIREWANAQPPS